MADCNKATSSTLAARGLLKYSSSVQLKKSDLLRCAVGGGGAAGYALDDGTSTETYPVIHMDAGSGVTKNGFDQVTEWSSRINTYNMIPHAGDLVRAPTYSASSSNLNSKPVIVFDGDDSLNGGLNSLAVGTVAGRNAIPSAVSQTFWVIMVVHYTAHGKTFWQGASDTWSNDASDKTWAATHGGVGPRAAAGIISSKYTNGSPSLGVFTVPSQNVWTWEFNGADSYLYDGLNRYPFNGDIGSIGIEEDFAIGGYYYSPASQLANNSEVAEVFIFDDLSVTMDGDTLDGGDLKVVVDYLKTKYSI